MKQISILGCGWLGLPLAKTLIKNNFLVNGSTTSENKIQILKNAGINPFLIEILENKITGEIEIFLENSDLLIIDIPPKLRGTTTENFVSKIENLIPFIQKLAVKKVVFVSSTSVYSDGFPIEICTEKQQPNPESESGKQLLEVENRLLKNAIFDTIILRFGGLIGEDRNPITFLSGKKNVENPEAPINLIHQEDCIGIILKILETQSWNEVYNCVNPFHPTRKEYYTQKAIELEIPIPEFDDTKTSVGKMVSSGKLQNVLGYEYVCKI